MHPQARTGGQARTGLAKASTRVLLFIQGWVRSTAVRQILKMKILIPVCICGLMMLLGCKKEALPSNSGTLYQIIVNHRHGFIDAKGQFVWKRDVLK